MKYIEARWILIVLIIVSGCKQGVSPPMRGREDVADGYGIFLSQSQKEQLRKETAFNPERVARDQFGLLSVNIPLRSTTNRTQYLEYQYAFFDEAGTQVEGPLGWQPVTLEAGSAGNNSIDQHERSGRELSRHHPIPEMSGGFRCVGGCSKSEDVKA